MKKKKIILLGVILSLALILVTSAIACQGPAGPVGPAATAKCSDCHNDTTLVLAKTLQWEESLHSNYETASTEGVRNTCGGCHSSEGYVKRLAANIAPNIVTENETNPTSINCWTCHQIHTTYTKADFALRSTAPVTLYITKEVFDKGEGNLCVTCHQTRTAPPAVGSGSNNVTSTRYGPHYGPQSSMLLGTGGYGPTSVSPHYTTVKDSCVQCHMVNGRHEMKPNIASCTPCHKGLTTFDNNKVQTEVKASLDELGKLLEAKGMLKNGSPVAKVYSEQLGGALWNYRFIWSDNSSGVHNPAYTKALLKSAIAALK
ncbi:MAG: hypothetical protein V1932_06035 [Chloroflexota bacterium]